MTREERAEVEARFAVVLQEQRARATAERPLLDERAAALSKDTTVLSENTP